MNWPTVALGDIFQIARGGSPRPIEKFITDEPEGINWVMISDASSKYITSTKKKIKPSGASSSRLVGPGDFLLTNSMSFGRPYIMRTSGCIHDGWLVLSPKNGAADSDYFYHLLGSNVLYSEFARRAAGATVKNLNIDLVRGVEVALPPLEEQRRIAAILDAADSLRSKRRAALAKLDQLAQSIFIDMFGDPIANKKGFPFRKLGDLVDESRGISYGIVQRGEDLDDGVAVLRISDITSGVVCQDKLKYTSKEIDSQYRRTKLKGGELVISIRGTVGLLAEIPVTLAGANVSRELAVIPLRDVMPSSFILHLLRSHPVQRRLLLDVRGIAQSGINLADLREVPVIQPPGSLVMKFCETIQRHEQIRTDIQSACCSMEALWASIQHRAFLGEL
jgi:type I restriction enzyme S subunit